MYVIGLGNPGEEYRNTRHNAGFMLVEKMTAGKKSRKRCRGEYFSSRGKISGFFKPFTYMNLSGRAVACLAEELNFPVSDIVVCHDDLDIPLGEIRVKFGGGSGGHKGIISIADELGTNAFARLRIGISKPDADQDPADYVLEPFGEAEKDILNDVLTRAASAVHTICIKGVSAAQTIHNMRMSSEAETEKNNKD